MMILAIFVFALYVASMVLLDRAIRNEWPRRVELLSRESARESADAHRKANNRRIVEFVSRAIRAATATAKTSVVLSHRFDVLFETDEPGGVEIDAPIGFDAVASFVAEVFSDYEVRVTDQTIEIVW